jgi:hypothetical protein
MVGLQLDRWGSPRDGGTVSIRAGGVQGDRGNGQSPVAPVSKTAREKTDLGLPFPTEQLAFAELRRQRFEREAASAAPSKLDPTDKVRQHLKRRKASRQAEA